MGRLRQGGEGHHEGPARVPETRCISIEIRRASIYLMAATGAYAVSDDRPSKRQSGL